MTHVPFCTRRRLRLRRRIACGFERLELRAVMDGGVGGVAGWVYFDQDGDGSRDPLEPGLSGWTVFADSNDDGQPSAGEPSVVTDATGRYQLSGLPIGLQRIRQVQPAGWARTAPFADVWAVMIPQDQIVEPIDFGNQILDESLYAVVSGFKWLDANRNGLRDSTEPGLAGWQIYLDLNRNGTLDAAEPWTYTNAAGRYSFERLPPVELVVAEVQQAGWEQSFPAPASPTFGRHVVGLEPGDVADPLNFGNYLANPGRIDGLKWRDFDRDGERDVDEPLLENWQFYIDADRNGRYDEGETVASTNSEGVFEFLGLSPGAHWIGEKLPIGWLQTSPGPSSGWSAAESFTAPSPPTRPASGGAPVGRLVGGDLDGDGDVDLVAPLASGAILFFNDGAGRFAARRTFAFPGSFGPAWSGTGAVELADFNGDGRLDVVVGARSSSLFMGAAGRTLTYLNGPGGFLADPLVADLTLAADLLTVGDWNHDGLVDVAAAEFDGATIGLLLGTGGGVVSAGLRPNLDLGAGRELVDLVAGDFNADGRDDLAAVAIDASSVGPLPTSQLQVWNQQTDGSMVAASPLTLPGVARDLLTLQNDGDPSDELLLLFELPTTTGLATVVRGVEVTASGASLTGEWFVHAGEGLSVARSSSLGAVDFDRDGRLDLVVADEAGGSLWILEGRPGGRFDSPRRVMLADRPIALFAGPLDGGRGPDLAVLDGLAGGLTVLPNDGWGGFPQVDRLATQSNGGGPAFDDVRALDVDGDGRLDLIGVDRSTGRAAVALQRGTGRFDAPRVWQVAPSLAAVEFADVDRDGDLDLIGLQNLPGVEGEPDEWRMFVRDWLGDDWSPLRPIIQGPGFATAAELGDLNGDDRIDVLTTIATGPERPELTFVSLLGDGLGGFTSLNSPAPSPRETGDRLLVDFDGDGRLDRLVPSLAGDALELSWNLGGGLFSAPIRIDVGGTPVALAAVDVDGDSDPDVVVARQASLNLLTLINAGAAAWGAEESGPTAAPVFGFAVGDFNGDGEYDLAALQTGADQIEWLLGDGAGRFASAVVEPVGDGPNSLVAADFDLDNRLDLAVLNSAGGALSVLLQTAGLQFDRSDFPTGAAPRSLSLGHLDDDDAPDLYLERDVAGEARLFELLNDGNGRFAAPEPLVVDRTRRETAVGDMNGDGFEDLVTIDEFARSIEFRAGLGDGRFAAPQRTPLEARPHFLQLSDLDGDSDLDVSVGWLDRSAIGGLINDGAAGFSPALDYVLGAPPRTYWLGDMNDDGRPDLVTPSADADGYEFARGLGDGSFQGASFHAGAGGGPSVGADVDGDGQFDLVAALTGGELAVYWNQTRPDDRYRVTVLPGKTSSGLSFGNDRPGRPWQNPRNVLDVDDDTFVAPIDALLLINRLNAHGPGRLPDPQDEFSAPPYYDTSGDDFLAPDDALLIINHLNGLLDGEGEAADFDSRVDAALAAPSLDVPSTAEVLPSLAPPSDSLANALPLHAPQYGDATGASPTTEASDPACIADVDTNIDAAPAAGDEPTDESQADAVRLVDDLFADWPADWPEVG